VNSRRRELDKAHRIATRQAAESPCLVCGLYPSVPAHYPTHRGFGSGKAGWERHEWIPLCRYHHDLIDRRLGVSAGVEQERRIALAIVERRRGVRA
jgi:hypothetical protein